MISSVLAIAIAATTAQASDTTRQAREAFTGCLRGFVDRSLDGGMSAEEFQAQYPQQCAAEQAAFRAAIIRRETGARMSQADAEDSANLEIEDARVNFSERFEMAAPADPPPQPEPQPEAAPAAADAPADTSAEAASEPHQ
jgi:hypothetical protein